MTLNLVVDISLGSSSGEVLIGGRILGTGPQVKVLARVVVADVPDIMCRRPVGHFQELEVGDRHSRTIDEGGRG